jgi:hypothetical protein
MESDGGVWHNYRHSGIYPSPAILNTIKSSVWESGSVSGLNCGEGGTWGMVSSGMLRRVALVRTDVSEEPTEQSQLMLHKVCGFHGGGYEECRLLGYKNRVHTSKETLYVSATYPSRLMLCKILGFHGSDYKEFRLLECYAIWLL